MKLIVNKKIKNKIIIKLILLKIKKYKKIKKI